MGVPAGALVQCDEIVSKRVSGMCTGNAKFTWLKLFLKYLDFNDVLPLTDIVG
jgi:hypothetical protein